MKSVNQFSDATSFQYSLDWRFFLPISNASRVLYIGAGGEEVRSFFQRLNVHGVFHLERNLLDEIQLFFASGSRFDVISIPYDGFPPQVYIEIKKILRPGGSLLLGFSNYYRARDEHAISIFEVRSLLKTAGFSRVKYYGVLPDQRAPEYIFPLDLRSARFVLRHRYRRRMKFWLLQTLSLSPFLFVLLYFLPAYYVVAKSDGD